MLDVFLFFLWTSKDWPWLFSNRTIGTCILGFRGCNYINHWLIETAMNRTKNYRTGTRWTIDMYLHTTVVLDFSSWIKPVSGFWCPVLLRSFGIRCCATHWVWSSFQQLAGGSSWALTRQETPHRRVGSFLGQFQRSVSSWRSFSRISVNYRIIGFKMSQTHLNQTQDFLSDRWFRNSFIFPF